MYEPSMKTRMEELEVEKARLSSELAEAPESPALRLHPRLVDHSKEKITNLSSAMSDPSVKLEATEALRGRCRISG